MDYAEEMFRKYEFVRETGHWNMISQWDEAMIDMGLDPKSDVDRFCYRDCQDNYAKYAAKWLA